MMTIEEIRKLLAAITPGRWAITTYNGGISFNGPKRVYCGTDERYGEPRTIPDSDADVEFIAAAPVIVRELLTKLEELEEEKNQLLQVIKYALE